MSASLDGFAAASDGSLYELLAGYWPTAEVDPNATPMMAANPWPPVSEVPRSRLYLLR